MTETRRFHFKYAQITHLNQLLWLICIPPLACTRERKRKREI